MKLISYLLEYILPRYSVFFLTWLCFLFFSADFFVLGSYKGFFVALSVFLFVFSFLQSSLTCFFFNLRAFYPFAVQVITYNKESVLNQTYLRCFVFCVLCLCYICVRMYVRYVRMCACTLCSECLFFSCKKKTDSNIANMGTTT